MHSVATVTNLHSPSNSITVRVRKQIVFTRRIARQRALCISVSVRMLSTCVSVCQSLRGVHQCWADPNANGQHQVRQY